LTSGLRPETAVGREWILVSSSHDLSEKGLVTIPSERAKNGFSRAFHTLSAHIKACQRQGRF
jgi:hypothetical protein